MSDQRSDDASSRQCSHDHANPNASAPEGHAGHEHNSGDATPAAATQLKDPVADNVTTVKAVPAFGMSHSLSHKILQEEIV
jgi:Cu+-exporting ATPase